MTTFTKVSSIVLRGSIFAALAAAATQLAASGAALVHLFPEQAAASGITATGTANLASLMGQGKMLTAILLLAALSSFFAFRSTGKAASTFRTVTLFGLTFLSTAGTFLFHVSDVVLRSATGAASTTQLAAVKPIMDAASQSGVSGTELAGTFTTFGMMVPAVIAAVLVILSITSIVAIVKTVKAGRKESRINAYRLQSVQMN